MKASNAPRSEHGYHKLASLMTEDQNIAIFRRFDYANVLCLLSLQSEIQELQEDFRFQCKKDETSGDPEKQAYSRWFKQVREAENGRSFQYQKLKVLRESLKDYSR